MFIQNDDNQDEFYRIKIGLVFIACCLNIVITKIILIFTKFFGDLKLKIKEFF